MNIKLGIGLVVFMVAAVAAVLYLTMGSSTGPEYPLAQDKAPKAAVDAGGSDGTAPKRTATSADGTAEDTEEAPAEADAEPAEESGEEKTGKKRRVGNGTITGTTSFAQKGGDMGRVSVELTLVDWENHEVRGEDTLARKITPKADGTFEEKNLPWGTYVAVATSPEGYFGIDDATVSEKYDEGRITLQLFPGGQISGRVLDKQGQPIENARVLATHYRGMLGDTDIDQNWVKTIEERSGADGHYVLPHLIDGTYEIVAKAEGYGTSSIKDVKLGAKGADIVLAGAGSASGTVIDLSSDEPLPDIVIKLASRFWMDQYQAKTDGQGHFVLKDLPEGEHLASVVHDQYVASSDTSRFQVKAEQETSGLRIGVTLGGLITGRIYDKEKGTGIPGVTIHINSANRSTEEKRIPISKEAVTDTDGAYSFDGLVTGGYRLQREQIKGYPNEWGTQDMERAVTLRAGEALENVDFALSQGLYIAGRILDPDGNGVADASVHSRSLRGNSYGDTDSESDGAFVIPGLQPNTEYYINVYDPTSRFASPASGPHAIVESSLEGVEIHLILGAKISGIVVDKAGRPVENVRVITRTAEQNMFGGSSDESDAAGLFEIARVGPGDYELFMTAPGANSWRNDMPAVETVRIAKAGDDVTGLRLVYDGDLGLSISGRVTNEQREGISGVHIAAQGPSYSDVRSDGDGNFEVAGLHEGEYMLNFSHGQYTTASESGIAAGTVDLQIEMRGRGAIEGNVYDALSGQPVQNFSITHSPGGQTQLEPYRNTSMIPMIDDAGHFMLPDVPEGTNTVFVKAEGYALAAQVVDGVVSGETLGGVAIQVQPGFGVSGVVVDSAGGPVANALIFHGGVPDEWMREQAKKTVSDSNGGFYVDDVPQGENMISAYHPKFAPSSAMVNVSGGNSTVQIVLGMGATLEGVVFANGQPKTGAYINVFMQQEGGERYNTSASTGPDGAYRISGLPAGEVSVSAGFQQANGGHRSLSQQAVLETGMITRVDFNADEGTAVLRGILLERAGEPRSGYASVALDTGLGMESFNSQVSGDGLFEFSGLPAGEATINGVLMIGGTHQSLSKSMTITAGQEHYAELNLESQIQLNVVVGNIPAGVQGAQVIALRGSHALPAAMDITWFATVQTAMAGAAVLQDGAAVLRIGEPGDYTLVALTIVNNNSVGDSTAVALSVPAGQGEVDISMSF